MFGFIKEVYDGNPLRPFDRSVSPSGSLAESLAGLLDVPWEAEVGHFTPVYVNDTLTLDFAERDSFASHHYCFHASDAEFDGIFARVRTAGIPYRSTPRGPDDLQLNTRLGVLTSVQPRIRLTRSFDQLSHTYQGYVLRVQGTIGEDQRGFIVAIGAGAHAKHQLQVGDSVSGLGIVVADPRLETAELYRVSQLRVSPRGTGCNPPPPPWHGLPPDLPTYRARGHRRLASRTYDAQCRSCIWGCRMAVEMIVDHWNPSQVRYRTETFCYGPLSCPIYRAGPRRQIPGRKGMSWEEPDWVDAEATSHRAPDE